MATKEEIMEVIKGMSVLELSDLVKSLEEEFGISAAAPVAVAAPAAAGASPADAAAAADESATRQKQLRPRRHACAAVGMHTQQRAGRTKVDTHAATVGANASDHCHVGERDA